MSELPPYSLTKPAFTAAVLPVAEYAKNPEYAAVFSWFFKEVGRLPEMKVNRSPLTNGKDWKATIGKKGEVDKITSPFFSLEGVDVSSTPLSWHQGAVIQRTEVLPTKSGEKTEVSGIIILLQNPKGETLVTVAQEPLMPATYRAADKKLSQKWIPQGTELHPVVRSSIQTSVEKLKQITTSEASGMRYDPTLTTLLATIATDRKAPITDILNGIAFSKAPTDGNRIVSNVVYGALEVSDEAAKKISEAVASGRWCSQKELDALVVSGLTNGHLNVAQSVIEAQKRLQTR